MALVYLLTTCKISNMATIEISKADLKSLKRLYKEALKRGKTEFNFYGDILLVSYAKYLIEYLETKLKKP